MLHSRAREMIAMPTKLVCMPIKSICIQTIFFLCVLVFANPAQAAPPDVRMALEEGKPRIEHIDGSFTVAESDDENVVHAELLPSGEILLEPKGRGVAHVFIFADRLVRVVEIAVGVALPEIAPAPDKACAKPRINAACYPAWRVHLQHLESKDTPPIEFELDGLQAEVKEAQAALDRAGIHAQLQASAFGVKLKGVADAAAERKGLRAIWPLWLGPLRVDR